MKCLRLKTFLPKPSIFQVNIEKVVEVGLEKAEEEDIAGKDEDGD